MFGNGLKSAIWGRFVERFGIKDIAEFYGATESNTTTINIENKIGSIGFLTVCYPDWLRSKFIPLYIVQVQYKTFFNINGLLFSNQDSKRRLTKQLGTPSETRAGTASRLSLESRVSS